jgi:O-antigen/teichoic acid export membrane protein
VNIVRVIKQSLFLRHNAIFMIGSVVVGALNYLYYPILGRLMDPSTFGEIQVLVSLFLQFTIFLNVLSLITVTITVNYKNKSEAHRMIFELEKAAAYVTLGILALSIIGGEFLRTQLRFESMAPFPALALAMMVSVPLTFRSAFARGQKKFVIASLSQLIASAVKIVLSVGLVILGLGVTGAMFGIVAAQFIAFLYAARWAARVGFSRPADTSYKTRPNIRLLLPELKYASAAFLGLLTITLFVSVDIIIVKYFFDAHTAGLYAGIATVARIIYFLAVPIAQVLMPSVKVSQTRKQNSQLLLKSLGLTVVVCGSVLVVGGLWPELIVRTLMGVDYITYASLLLPLMAAVFVVSVINLIFMYYLAIRKKTITLVGIIGIVATISLMLFAHNDLQTIVYNLLLGSIFTLIATGIYVLVNLKRGSGNNAKQDDFNRYSDLQ